MSTIAIQVENLSKQYRLGTVGTGTLSHDLNRMWAKVRGKEDPYLKIGESNDRSQKGQSDFVWALKDINFEVNQGEVLGIIGKNGAGKSTLLKILSRVTGPTTGSIKAKGRIASLLEVGTGFHPELTGRENIFLNGAILGMTRAEVRAKLDEIIDFAGVARYVDTPVKRYSSGMYVRLAFAVAAHLEPEILIVDEVLAVGDAEFQKKAIGKMKSVSEEGGRTVLFVSHSMSTIKQLTSRTILMKNGTVDFLGTTSDACAKYLSDSLIVNNANNTNDPKNFITKNFIQAKNIKAEFLNSSGQMNGNLFYQEAFQINLSFGIFQNMANTLFDLKFYDSEGFVVGYFIHNQNGGATISVNEGVIQASFKLINNFLPGKYYVDFGIHKSSGQTLFLLEKYFSFEVNRESLENTLDYDYNWKHGSIQINGNFTMNIA